MRGSSYDECFVLLCSWKSSFRYLLSLSASLRCLSWWNYWWLRSYNTCPQLRYNYFCFFVPSQVSLSSLIFATRLRTLKNFSSRQHPKDSRPRWVQCEFVHLIIFVLDIEDVSPILSLQLHPISSLPVFDIRVLQIPNTAKDDFQF